LASGTQNFEAWEIAIQIPELLESHRRENLLIARRLAEQALQLDEHYAAAWTMLGWTHWEEVFNGWSEARDSSLDHAIEALERSRSIDGTNPLMLALLAFTHLSMRSYDQAFELSERALTLGHSNSLVAATAANVALFCNRPRDSVVLLNKAMRLCPIYPAWYVGDLAWAHMLLDRLEDAIAIAQKAIKIDPDYIYTYCVTAIAHAELGHEAEAGTSAENIVRIEPKYTIRTFAESQPFRDTEVMDRHVRGLRKAGLPE
jgi:tetratricopeptide (TPR) repeat protein